MWGDGGYIRLARGNSSNAPGQCGVAMQASYPVKTGPNPPPTPPTPSPKPGPTPPPGPEPEVCDSGTQCPSGKLLFTYTCLSCCCTTPFTAATLFAS